MHKIRTPVFIRVLYIVGTINLFTAMTLVCLLSLFSFGCTSSESRGSSASIDRGKIEKDSASDNEDVSTPTDREIDEKREAGTICCSNPYCLQGLGVYTDGGIDKYIATYYGRSDYSDNAIVKLLLFCFSESVNCEDFTIDIRTGLDTYTLPWSDTVQPTLELGADLFYQYPKEEKLSSYVSQEISDQNGWKAEISAASIVYGSTTCDNGPVRGPYIDLKGSLDNVRFVRDSSDALPYYVVLKNAEGNIVLDNTN
jgi:hypothetical protein